MPAEGPGRASAGAEPLARIEALEAQVATLTDALNEARARIAKLEGSPPPAPIRGRPPRGPARPRADPELQGLMRRLIGLQADRSQVEQAAEAMARWAGDDPRKKAELADYCRLVLGLGYGTDAAKDALEADGGGLRRGIEADGEPGSVAAALLGAGLAARGRGRRRTSRRG